MFKRLSGLFLVFGIVCLLSFGLKDQLANWKIDYRVVAGANALLLVLGIISLSLHTKALSNPNPNVFVRSVMLANVIKIFVLAAAAFIYINVAGKKAVSTNAVFVSLFLYIVYTWVEKRETIKMSKSQKN
jgi:ACR3 family arsenite efflux pump ArsB